MEVKFRNPGLDQAPSTRPGGDRMQRPDRPQEPDSSSADLGGENQLDFFRKLGYSSAQVRAVMQKFGADTDRVLGELVRMGASPEGHEEESSLTSSSTRSSSSSSSGVSELGSRGGSSREAESPDEGGESSAEALRPIVIDGSNVAMSHGNKEVFSCRGIQLAVDFFLERGHSDVIVFVPSWRKEPSRPDVPISDQHLLRELEKRKIVVFTPSRRVAGKRVVCYDDRFIVKLAHESAGVIVSNDTYRDLQGENPEWKRFIEGSLLMYFFVSDRFIVPDDPLGRHGPTLDNFLRRVPKTAKKHPCPYGRKCTYGIKCKFDHPERGHQSNMALADELREKVKPSSSHQRPPVSLSSRGSLSSGLSQCLSLEEEMAQKLSLQHHHSSSASRKYPASENVPVKGGPHSGRRNQSRKEKASHPSSSDREPLRSTGSQLQLDSGLGSIENHSTDVSGEHGSRRYAEGYGLSHPALSQGPPYYPASTGPCSCCLHAHPTLGNPTTTSSPHQHPHQHSGPHHSMWPLAGAPNPDAVAYGPALYLGPGPFYPMSMQGHSHPTDFQNRRVFQPAEGQYWSDPYATVSHAVPYGVPGERPAPWGYHQPPSTPAGGREMARKKLLAIFNSQLVDQAMEMNPNVLDPQVLVAEIIRLQGQDRARR